MKKFIKSSSQVKSFIALLFLQILFIGIGVAQTKAEKIDDLMSKYSDYGQFNGSVLIAEEGDLILKKGYGMANME